MGCSEYKREPIKGYEEYQVDTNGVVYSKKGKPLKYSLNHGGYCIVNFYINGRAKGFAIHTLVAKQFIFNNNPDKTQINHKDGNKRNNNVDNLEWVTPTENMRHAVDVLGNYIGAKNWRARPIKGTNKKNSIEINFESLSDGARFFAKKYNINFSYAKNSLWRVLNGIRKTYKGYYWIYV